jgi:hypothetical protein
VKSVNLLRIEINLIEARYVVWAGHCVSCKDRARRASTIIAHGPKVTHCRL